MAEYLTRSGGFKSSSKTSIQGDESKLLQEQAPGKLLAQYLDPKKNPSLKFDFKIEIFNIIINTESDHPALKKFVNSGGIPPIFEICC